jgi:hypothetical protein
MEKVAELSMLCGFDDDVVGQITPPSNRIRGRLTQIHPALERVLGPHLDHPAVLDLLHCYPSPTLTKAADTTRLGNRLIKLAPRMGRRLADEITQALEPRCRDQSGSGGGSCASSREKSERMSASGSSIRWTLSSSALRRAAGSAKPSYSVGRRTTPSSPRYAATSAAH